MIRSLNLALFFLLTILATSVLAQTKTECPMKTTAPDVVPDGINVKEMMSAESARYGRELFRRGDYAEAAKVFEHILKSDCSNSLAQYHLLKIANKGPEFAYIKSFLRTLPCPVHDFKEEDFLPASFYYEKDTDLLIEQISATNRRFRHARDNVDATINAYIKEAEALEVRVNDLNRALLESSGKDKTAIAELQKRLQQTRDSASRMDNELAGFKEQLAQTKITNRQLEKAVATAKAETTTVTTVQTTPGVTFTPASTTGKTAARAIRNNERLASLRDRVASIQGRLNRIEQTLVNQDSQIKTIGGSTQK